MKPSTTIEEQIIKLERRGVKFSDIEKCKENLLDIGYFRLGFYSFPFEKTFPKKHNRTHEYIEGTLFDDIISLYYFDVDLRNILYRYISRVEINIRTYIIYTVSNYYKKSPTWFVDHRVVSRHYISQFDKYVYTKKFKDISVIKNHHQHYLNDKYAPAWKTIEFMTFGAVIRLYSSLLDVDLKKKIAKHYGYKSVNNFENNLKEALLLIRNSCAHGNVLFDIRTHKAISNGPVGKMNGNKNNLAGILQILKYFLGIVSQNRLLELENQLTELFEGSKNKRSETINNIITRCSGLNILK